MDCGHQGAPGHAIPQLIWASLVLMRDALRTTVTRAPLVMPFLSSSGRPRKNEGCITAYGHQGAPGHAIPQLIWALLSEPSYNKGAPPPSGCPSVFGTRMYYGLRSPGRPWPCHSSSHQSAPGHAISQLIWAPLSELSYNKGAPPPPGCLSVSQERPWSRQKSIGRPYIRHLVSVPDHQERPRLPRFY